MTLILPVTVGTHKRVDLGAVADNLPQRFLDRVQERLRFKNPAFAQVVRYAPKGKTIYTKEFMEFAEFDGDELVVPRGTPLGAIARQYNVGLAFDWRTVKAPVAFPRAVLKLRDIQGRAVRAATRSGLIVLPTAAGKTITGLAIAQSLGQKTLIITHRGSIMKAWIDDIAKFFGPRLKTGDVGIIQRKSYSIGRLITLATVQTLMRRDLTGLRNFFGLVIMDEGHHTPANTFRGTVEQFPAHYRVGITATLDREDGFGPLVKDIFGPILHEEQQDRNIMPVEVRLVPTALELPPQEDGEPFNFNAYMDAQVTDPVRNSLICSMVAREYAAGRACLVMSTRIAHVKALSVFLRKAYKIPAVAMHGAGGFDEDVLDDVDSGKTRVVVSTYSLLGEGTNCPRWDRMFLTASLKARALTAQLVGRIRRMHKDKKDAMLYDFVDTRVPVGFGHWKKRLAVYSRLGFRVTQERRTV